MTKRSSLGSRKELTSDGSLKSTQGKRSYGAGTCHVQMYSYLIFFKENWLLKVIIL